MACLPCQEIQLQEVVCSMERVSRPLHITPWGNRRAKPWFVPIYTYGKRAVLRPYRFGRQRWGSLSQARLHAARVVYSQASRDSECRAPLPPPAPSARPKAVVTQEQRGKKQGEKHPLPRPLLPVLLSWAVCRLCRCRECLKSGFGGSTHV